MNENVMAEKRVEGSLPKECSSGQKKEEKEEEFCPLFMDGLPSDFAKNKSLAAIASLLDDGSDNIDAEHQISKKEDVALSKVELKSGGGKVQRSRRRKGTSPYNKEKKKGDKDKKAASIGEAQLFLNMWKI